jgi:hypothetical protein
VNPTRRDYRRATAISSRERNVRRCPPITRYVFHFRQSLSTVTMMMFDASLKVANFWYDMFNIVLIAGAIAVAIGIYGSIRMGAIKERYSNERISSNEAATARAVAESDTAKTGAETAKANAAIATARAANLEKEAAQLRLSLEAAREETLRISQGVSSRHVFPAQSVLIASALREKHFNMSVTSWSAGEPEVNTYRDELSGAFRLAGVDVSVGSNTVVPSQVGLVLIDTPDRNDSAVAQALGTAGIDFEYRRVDTPALILRVGIKRPTL